MPILAMVRLEATQRQAMDKITEGVHLTLRLHLKTVAMDPSMVLTEELKAIR